MKNCKKVTNKILSMVLSILLISSALSVALGVSAETSGNISVWDGSATTAFAGGTGTESDPYLISNGAELKYLANQVNAKACADQTLAFAGKYFKLTADIYLNEISNYDSWETTAPSNKWTPIGAYKAWNLRDSFSGSFDGDGHTIYGLYVNTAVASGSGLFGYIASPGKTAYQVSGNKTATIKNLKIAKSLVKNSGNSVGGLAGIADGPTSLQNCSYSGKVIGTNNQVGGLIGKYSAFYDPSIDVNSCYVEGEVSGNILVGGMIGDVSFDYSKSTPVNIVNSYVAANVKNDSADGRVNGFIGTMRDSTSTVNILRSFYYGTLDKDAYATFVQHNYCTLNTTDSYYNSNIIDSNADIIIQGAGKTTEEFKNGTVVSLLNEAANAAEDYTQSWKQGADYPVFKTETTARLANLDLSIADIGFIEGKFNYTVSVAYSARKVTVTPTGKDTVTSITVNGTAVALGSSTELNLNVGENTITIVTTASDGATETYTVTITRREKGSEWDGSVAEGYAGGTGAEEDPYQISNGAELRYFAENASYTNVKNYYELTADIYLNDITDYSNWDDSKVRNTLNKWTSMGYYKEYQDCKPFEEYFNGNGYTIYGLYINEDTQGQGTGLFGAIGYGAVVKNLNISSAYIIGKKRVGGIAGVTCGNVDIINTHFNGIITTADANRNQTNVWGNTHNYLGGLLGYFEGNTTDSININSCTTAGEIRAQYMAGGFIGASSTTLTININNSSSTMNIGYGSWASIRLGGFIGFLKNAKSDVNTTINIRKSFFAGKSDFSSFDPIVGEITNDNPVDIYYSDSYYNRDSFSNDPLWYDEGNGITEYHNTEFSDGTVAKLLNNAQSDYATDYFVWQQSENGYPIPKKILLGDCNGDGNVDILDLVRIKKYSADIEVDFVMLNADLVADNKINTDDIVRLRKKLLCDNAQYLSADEAVVNSYMSQADSLKKKILGSETNVTVTGTKYYVSASGDDNAAGTSPEAAWKTIARVNKATLNSGDGVFFNRGDKFRTEEPLKTSEGVTYSAYGTGSKPMIVASTDASGSSNWEKTQYTNIYKCKISFPKDRNVGTIIFNGGEAWGIQVQKRPNGYRLSNGTVFNGIETFTDDRKEHLFAGINELKNNLEFYNVYEENTDSGELYLYSAKGNPGDVFKSIEIADKGYAVYGTGKNVIIDNISVFGSGSHGIVFDDVAENTVVQYCSFSWIGGSIHSLDTTWRILGTRYGNAVEAWNCNNFVIHDCYSEQIYDSCYTVQSAGASIIGFKAYNNISDFCTTGYEVWASNDTKTGTIKDLDLHDNYTRFAGYGWSHQRPENGATFFSGNTSTRDTYENNNVYNNINLFSSKYTHDVAATGCNQLNFHNNTYVMEPGKYLGGILANPGEGIGDKKVATKYNEDAIIRAYETGFERGSVFYHTDKSPYDNMYDIYKAN